MPFGNPVNVFTQVAVGTKGYIIAADLSGNLIDEIRAVQMSDGATLSPLFTSQSDASLLYGYPEAPSPPTLAFLQRGNVVFVFVNSLVYPFGPGSLIAFQFYQVPIDLVAMVDKLDIPPKYRNLWLRLFQRGWKRTVEHRIPFDVEQAVTREKALNNLN